MPYFVRIGVIKTNRKGVGSRGYHIYRRGRKVFHAWGQVKVGAGPRFFWIWKQTGMFLGRTESQAATWQAAEILRRVRREKYHRLPVGQKISD